MRVAIRKDHPDGLDPVLEAYAFIRRVVEAAEPIDDYYDEEKRHPIGDDMVRIPGTGEIIELNDYNVMNGLERWLEKRIVNVPTLKDEPEDEEAEEEE